MPRKIVPIVEGDGEVSAVPILLHRLLHQRGESRYQVAVPKNAHGCGNLSRVGGIEKFVRYAWLEPNCAAVIVIVDGDAVDGCPVDFARTLVARINRLGGRHPVAIVIANREYEAWFLASLPSIVGKQIAESLVFPNNVVFDGNPESVRDVKGWITRQLPRGKAYKETEHQAPMTRLIDLTLAMNRSRSFRRICNAIDDLLSAVDAESARVTPENSP